MIVMRLKEIAEQRNLNAHQISMQTGISYPTISKYWKNQATSYDRSVLDKLCALLACEPGDLLRRIPPPA